MSAAPDVRVWRIALDPASAPDADALAQLSLRERARAEQFYSDDLRFRWLHGHVATRRILAQALGVAPSDVAYGEGASGKPFLVTPGGSGLEYNYSDSGELGLLAVSTVGAVGADVEAMRRLPELERITERFFSVEEREAILSLPAAERHGAFHRVWARKEAYIKAVGDGLAHGLHRFAVTYAKGDARFVQMDGSREEARAWTLAEVEVPSGYEAAVAIRRPAVSIEVLDYR